MNARSRSEPKRETQKAGSESGDGLLLPSDVERSGGRWFSIPSSSRGRQVRWARGASPQRKRGYTDYLGYFHTNGRLHLDSPPDEQYEYPAWPADWHAIKRPGQPEPIPEALGHAEGQTKQYAVAKFRPSSSSLEREMCWRYSYGLTRETLEGDWWQRPIGHG